MTPQTDSTKSTSIWADEDTANYLQLRLKTFYNADYLERVVLPLLNIPPNGCVLDVGCGYGGFSFLLAKLRPDLQITGTDMEASATESAANSAKNQGSTNITFEQGDAHNLESATL